MKFIKTINQFFFSEKESYTIAVYRIILFGFAAYFLINDYKLNPELWCEEWRPYGIFKIFGNYCSQTTYHLLFVVGFVGSILAILGIFYRPFGFVAALAVTLFLGYKFNFLRMYHSYHMYVMVLLIVSLGPAADTLSLKWIKNNTKHWKYNWPIQLSKLYVVYVYFICGVEKLYFRGLDWAFSDNLYLIVFTTPQEAFLKDWILHQPLWVAQTLAFWSLFICELFAPLALINRYWGYCYWLIWLSFHVGVSFTLGGHSRFFSQLVAASVFLIPLIESVIKKISLRMVRDPKI